MGNQTDLLRLFFDHASQAILILGPSALTDPDPKQGRTASQADSILDCNPATEKLFSIPKEQLCKLSLKDLMPETQPNGTDSLLGLQEKIRNESLRKKSA